MAAILGSTHPDLYAAVGVHSGLAAGAARDLPSALAAMKHGGRPMPGERVVSPPTIVFHGDADTVVHPANATHVVTATSTSALRPEQAIAGEKNGRRYTTRVHRDASGMVRAELWLLHGAGHAWSGGSTQGSYADAAGPDASEEMMRFFLQQVRSPG